jgi:hypothetical protein
MIHNEVRMKWKNHKIKYKIILPKIIIKMWNEVNEGRRQGDCLDMKWEPGA